MDFSNPLFHIPFGSGCIFILLGLFQLKFPPKKINSIYGYRTSKSMLNQNRWNFAQKYASIQLIKIGFVLVLLSLLSIIYQPNKEISILIGIVLLLTSVITLILKVEKAIDSKFKENNK
ncbi:MULTISPECIES: SdpI family protein [unclassified Cellulophaga]|uniref:SdpI family protein n=1 Tax=unclassified Cellulophaga TaxID=2634405 RepID=UPI0026E2635B|nr:MULTISPECIES: SdpI family protein [unclassified Cellulophaga]MDO6490764.1 SdpI family protein [Cellulophaga sp. 2_MG-2023]MDO6494042.1 SdpI family protein [Cellulophaga sp. 3_MG-2023]